MRCGIIVGVLCATLTLGGGCVGSPRWEYAAWQVDDAHVVEAEPEAAYPAEPLGGPLAAARIHDTDDLICIAVLASIIIIGLALDKEDAI